ncbi:phosphate/phosphite/phosphonate ABC transporter substrate-binding protein [Paludibaculum fermentans]|uniref:phosphate/phosphite/phosphonate ABC transporter substrate-binding protein n=1 Tax=Paludibaculum fermentans TaxID=1473598 RepID=UPI003EC02596
MQQGRPEQLRHPVQATPVGFFLALVCVSVLAIAQPAGQVNGEGAGGRALRRTRVNVVTSDRMLYGVNQNDVRSALKVWFETVARQRGFLLDCKVDIVESSADLKARLLEKSVDVVIPGIAEYLDLESSHLMVPILTLALNSGSASYSYVLLVNPASKVTSLAELRGKSILVSSRGGSNTALAWTDVALSREKLGRAGTFFSSIRLAPKAQACILPLFFGTVDACVVDEVNLNLAKEMNPQLSRLKVLMRSRPLVESVIATPVEPHPYRAELVDAILSLHEDVRHRQLLMVFKTDRIVRLQAGDLDPVRELWREYSHLPGAAQNRVPSMLPIAEYGNLDRGKGRN